MNKMDTPPLAYDSIVPIGTHLRYLGGSTLKEGEIYVVIHQDIPKDKGDTHWVHLEGKSTGYNPRIFEIVSPSQSQDVWGTP